jgi:putative transposase
MKTGLSSSLNTLVVSYETLRKAAQRLDQKKLIELHWGQKVADKVRGPRLAGVTTTYPLERVEIDHFLADVHLIHPVSGAVLGRPWLTVATDHFSGVVLGYYISFAPPNAASVLAALRSAILPKSGVSNA